MLPLSAESQNYSKSSPMCDYKHVIGPKNRENLAQFQFYLKTHLCKSTCSGIYNFNHILNFNCIKVIS